MRASAVVNCQLTWRWSLVDLVLPGSELTVQEFDVSPSLRGRGTAGSGPTVRSRPCSASCRAWACGGSPAAPRGPRLLRRERLVQRRELVGVQVVHHQHDLLGLLVGSPRPASVHDLGEVHWPGALGRACTARHPSSGSTARRRSAVPSGRTRSPPGDPVRAWPGPAHHLADQLAAARPCTPPAASGRRAGGKPSSTSSIRAANSASAPAGWSSTSSGEGEVLFF